MDPNTTTNMTLLLMMMTVVSLEIAIVRHLQNNPLKRRRGPTRCPVKRRKLDGFGEFRQLLQELRDGDPLSYENWLRMDAATFDWLVNLLTPVIRKQYTNSCTTIDPDERLAITLRYLSTGMTFKDLSTTFRIGQRTAAYIVLDTCAAIFGSLKDVIFQLPSSPEGWLKIVDKFKKQWNFPALGSLDGKHIVIKKPAHTGSHHHNYKGTFSIVLMALVDADYKFTFIDVGKLGRVSDGSGWQTTQLHDLLENNNLNLPPPAPLPSRTMPVQLPIIANAAFPLRTYLQKPYGQRNLGHKEAIYNYRLSRARQTVEITFGILAARLKVFQAPIQLDAEKATVIVKAACALHNLLMTRKEAKDQYIPQGVMDHRDEDGEFVPGSWRREFPQNTLIPLGRNNIVNSPYGVKAMRDEFRDYFCSTEGSVPWQKKVLKR